MTKLNALIRRYNQCVEGIAPEGYVLQGSVVQRHLHRTGSRGSKAYGPYFLWTCKVDNKTVTHALTREQAQIIEQAICANRQLEQRLAKLRALSQQIIFAITPCVARRKRAQ